MSKPLKVTFHNVDPDDYVLAGRAARWLLKEPTTLDQYVGRRLGAILAYGEGAAERSFYVYFTNPRKTAIAVWGHTKDTTP